MNDSIITGMQAHLRYHDGAELKLFDADAASFDNAFFDLSVDVTDTISIQAVLKQPLQLQLFTVKLTVKKSGAVSYLNRYYQVEALTDTVYNNDLTPAHIQFRYLNSHYAILGGNKHYAHSITDKGDAFELTLYIDAAALHPKWSYRTQQRQPGVSPQLQPGHTYNLALQLLKSDAAMQLPILNRYPNGAAAAFIITDHCDYDNTQRLQTFLQSWLGKDLKMTKGVFTIPSSKQASKHAPTLQDEAYRALIQQLYNDGSEIAPHALAQSGQLNSEIFHDGLEQIQQQFAPATWIDHGTYLKYCYTTGGATHPDYELVKTLQQQGYTSVWSYHDTPVMPHQSLNIFSDAAPEVSAIISHKLMQGKLQVALHYLKNYLERSPQRSTSLLYLFSAFRMAVSKRSLSKFWKDVTKAFRPQKVLPTPYSQEELALCAPVIYPETAQPLYTYKDGMLVFNTQEVVHVQDAYTPAMLDKLIMEQGLHIGHTYILNNQPYIDGIFNDGQLSEKWKRFVGYLSGQVKQGTVWNPTLREFIAWHKTVQQLIIEYTNTGVRITNPTTNTIKGLSFKDQVAQGSDIPAGATIELIW